MHWRFNMVPQTTPHFSSPYAPVFYSFVEHKRLEGYKYNTGVSYLHTLDLYCKTITTSPIELKQEDLSNWLSKRENQSSSNFAARNTVYSHLYKYCKDNNISYFPEPKLVRQWFYANDFTPYIFSHDEIKRFFNALDNDHYPNPTFQRCAPVMIRLLYGTGLRINEVTSLLVSDIDLNEKYLVVRDGKYENSRIVPLSKSLNDCLAQYMNDTNYESQENLFQGRTHKQLDKKTVYDWFRRILWRAGIPHQDNRKGPRLHDFRHTFAVHSLQNTVENGIDINTFLPILSVYLGHRNLSATEKYLRLTAEVYPSIVDKVSDITVGIIPEVQDYED